MKNILLSCTSELELRAFRDLQSEGEVKIQGLASWGNPSKSYPNAEFEFGQLIFHSEVLAWSKEPSMHADKTQSRFGLDELKKFEPYERDFYLMIDRSDTLARMTLRERRESFIFAVEYWLGVMKGLMPDVVYFSGTPHEASDFALFACCEVLGIKTVMWQEFYLVDGKVLTRNWKAPWINQLQNSPADSISVSPDEFVNRYRADYKSAEPAYNKVAKRETDVLNGPGLSLLKIGRIAKVTGAGLRGLLTEWKVSITRSRELYGLALISAFFWEMLQKTLKGLQMLKIAGEVRLARKSLSRHVLSKIPEEKFIVYFLHYEPELTVVPMGWVGGDQYIAIASLVKNLPDGWQVVVREHPAQYAQSFAGYFTGRNKDFYNRILGIGRVSFVSNDIDTFDLIDKCEFVSTITGTVGWEALVRGKPSVIFGDAWYSEAPGLQVCKSEDDLKSFMRKICSAPSDLMGASKNGEIATYVKKLFQQFDKIVLDPETAQLNDTEFDLQGSGHNLKERLREAFRVL
jgi:hypothetical protein